MLDVRSAVIDSKDRIWTGTTGGLFVYDSSGNEPFLEFRNSDGLLSMDFTAMSADTVNKKIYMGTYDGYIEIADEDFNFNHITDIVAAGFPNSIINDIYLHDTLAYIGGGFGLTVFDLKHNVFLETVTRLGQFQPNTPVKQILIKNNYVWLATEAGIAVAELSSQIIDPQVWKNYTSSNGLLAQEPVVGICFHRDTLFAATNKILYKMENGSFIVRMPQLPDWDDFTRLTSKNDTLFYTTKYDAFKLDYGTLNLYYLDNILNNHIITDNALILMYKELGLRIIEKNNIRFVNPNTPSSNLFLSMDLDENGYLWSATDYEGRGKGFMKFSNGIWTNFTSADYPEILNNSYFKIFSDKNGKIFASNWGSGLCILEEKDTGNVFKIINNKNSPMKGIAESDDWVIAGECAVDEKGVVWFPNFGRIYPGPSLIAYKKDGTFADFENPSFPTQRSFISIAIDNNGTKWCGSSPFEELGLMYFNERNTIDDKQDDISGVITTSSSGSKLLKNSQTALAVDHLGALWIGYESGLSVMFNPSAVLESGRPTISIREVKMLSSQRVNDIFIDALNNKWIATGNGIWVLNPDGTETIAIINKSNSKLIDDAVYSIVIDPETGQAYFGTKKGLCSASTLSVKPLENYNVSCYPQPFSPGTDGYLTIDGLTSDSELKILTLDGALVKAMTVSGRKAIWDGRDNKGNFVSNGIYIIVTSSLSTETNSVGKIAVIRKK
jgi:ligand-binding sensor domain-containing protein